MSFAYLLTPNHEEQQVELQTVQFHGDGENLVQSIHEILEATQIDALFGRNQLEGHVAYIDVGATVEDFPGFIFMEDLSEVAIPGRIIVMGFSQGGDTPLMCNPVIPVGQMQELCTGAYSSLKAARATVNYIDAMTKRYK